MPEFPDKPPPPPKVHSKSGNRPLWPPPSLPSESGPHGDYGVPRRYGLDSILAVVTAFALLFGALIKLGVGPVSIGFFVIFVAGVGLSQALLFDGQDPRKASVHGGLIMALILVAVLVVYLETVWGQRTPICIVGGLVFLGPILGYVAGTLIAGIFLILDALEELFRKGRGRRAASMNQPDEGDPFGPAQRDADKDQPS